MAGNIGGFDYHRCGLIVAIPAVLAHHYLSNLADKIIDDISIEPVLMLEALEKAPTLIILYL